MSRSRRKVAGWRDRNPWDICDWRYPMFTMEDIIDWYGEEIWKAYRK